MVYRNLLIKLKNQSATFVTGGHESYRECLNLALVSVVHPDWLIRWIFRLRMSGNSCYYSYQRS